MAAKANIDPNQKSIAVNRRARYEYELMDTLECGIVLKGSEVKSLRQGKVSLEEAFAKLKDNELWLLNCDIATYPQATLWNHEPRRDRKLLLHKRERDKFAAKASQSGMTLIPTSIYLVNGRIKVQIAIAKGKQLHDKREQLKKDQAQREIRREMINRK